MNPETIIQRKVMLELSQDECTVFRNETGNFWTGKVIHRDGDTVTLSGARMIPCGLCVGSSDLIGWTADGRFLAVEIKTKTGKPTKEQLNFIAQVNKAGGVGFVARSADEALEMLNNANN